MCLSGQSDQDAARIVDANLNRAREALRVMEEFARFSLNDAGLCCRFKELRHELVGVVPADLAAVLRAARNVQHDVGCNVRTDQEFTRSSTQAVAQAASCRLGEALRAAEEYVKIIDPEVARKIESLRYRSYAVEQQWLSMFRAKERLDSLRLYVILSEAHCQGDWLSVAEAAVSRGADVLQLREKQLNDRELLRRARKLATLCREYETLFIVNDRPDIALLSGADGVHLGGDDIHVADARRILRPQSLVGVSTHNPAEVVSVVEEAPDYIAVGPMYRTQTKPRDDVPGLELLRRTRQRTALPLVAIGGIGEEQVPELLACGRCMICVCGSVFSQPDVGMATTRLRSIIDSVWGSSARVKG